MKNIDKKNCSGTTLIELMVVITILSLVILGLVTFFGGGIRSWISGQNQLRAQREARIVLDRIVKEIREANHVVAGDNSYERGIEISFPDTLSKDNVVYRFKTVNINDEYGSIVSIINNATNTLIDNIPNAQNNDEGFFIRYYDVDGKETSAGKDASKIKLTLQVDVDRDKNADITLETEVALRNF